LKVFILPKKTPVKHGGLNFYDLKYQSSSGNNKFRTTAKTAVGATADVANVFQIPGKY
jgi:hypothetical protein